MSSGRRNGADARRATPRLLSAINDDRRRAH